MTLERENEILKNLLHHAVIELAYVHSAEHISQTNSSHGQRIVDAGMLALGLDDLSDDSIIQHWPIEVSEWEAKAKLMTRRAR